MLHLVSEKMPDMPPQQFAPAPFTSLPVSIYLASRYDRLVEMQAYRDLLNAAGYNVVARWVNGEHEAYDTDPHLRHKFAQEDMEDVTRSNWVISFTEGPESNTRRGGRHVELGLGLGLGKRMIVIGWRENVFHYLPQVEFYHTWSEFWPGS